MYGTFLLQDNGVFQTPLITSTPQRKDEYNYLTPYLCDSSSSNSSSLISSESDTFSSELDYRENREEPKTDPLQIEYISLYEEITNELSKSGNSEHYSENNEILLQKRENSLKDHSLDLLLTFTKMTKPTCSEDLQGENCTHHVNTENNLDGNCSKFEADDPKLQEINTTEKCTAYPFLKSSHTLRDEKYQHQVSSNSFQTNCYGQLFRDYFVPLNYFVSNVTSRFRQK